MLEGISDFIRHKISKGPNAKPGTIKYKYENFNNVYVYFMIRHLTDNDFSSLCTPRFRLSWGKYITFASVAFDMTNSLMLISPRLTKAVKICMADTKKRFVYFSVALFTHNKKKTHINIILIDKKYKLIERFEPYGICEYGSIIDDALRDKFSLYIGKDYKYIASKEITNNKKGIQAIADSYNGMCVAISMMYLFLRVRNPDIDPRVLINELLSLGKRELKQLILRFAGHSEKVIKKNFSKIISLNNNYTHPAPIEVPIKVRIGTKS